MRKPMFKGIKKQGANRYSSLKPSQQRNTSSQRRKREGRKETGA